MNQNCFHQGKTTVCQIATDNEPQVDRPVIFGFALIGLLVAIIAFMAIRSTIQETRNV